MSAPQSLLMGGEHNIHEELFQRIFLPEGTFELELTGYEMVILPAEDADVVSLRLTDDSGNESGVVTITAAQYLPNTERVWRPINARFEVGAPPVITTFSIVATTDGIGFTSFAFDSLSLTARYIECL